MNMSPDFPVFDTGTLTMPMSRGIPVVLDCRHGPDPVPVTASTVLDTLTATEIVHLRRDLHLAAENSHAFFRCACCGGPLRLRVWHVRQDHPVDGRRSYFAHARGMPTVCDWRAAAPGPRAAAVDALRFDGRQEGRRHAVLKAMLAESLRADPAFDDIAVERRLDREGAWRRPDVSAQGPAGGLAYDVQLVPPLLHCALGREAFYRRTDHTWLWILDGTRADLLFRQGFLDVVLAQGGDVLAVDEETHARSRVAGELHLRLISVTELGDGRAFAITDRIVGRPEIDAHFAFRRAAAAAVPALPGPVPAPDDGAIARAVTRLRDVLRLGIRLTAARAPDDSEGVWRRLLRRFPALGRSAA